MMRSQEHPFPAESSVSEWPEDTVILDSQPNDFPEDAESTGFGENEEQRRIRELEALNTSLLAPGQPSPRSFPCAITSSSNALATLQESSVNAVGSADSRRNSHHRAEEDLAVVPSQPSTTAKLPSFQCFALSGQSNGSNLDALPSGASQLLMGSFPSTAGMNAVAAAMPSLSPILPSKNQMKTAEPVLTASQDDPEAALDALSFPNHFDADGSMLPLDRVLSSGNPTLEPHTMLAEDILPANINDAAPDMGDKRSSPVAAPRLPQETTAPAGEPHSIRQSQTIAEPPVQSSPCFVTPAPVHNTATSTSRLMDNTPILPEMRNARAIQPEGTPFLLARADTTNIFTQNPRACVQTPLMPGFRPLRQLPLTVNTPRNPPVYSTETPRMNTSLTLKQPQFEASTPSIAIVNSPMDSEDSYSYPHAPMNNMTFGFGMEQPLVGRTSTYPKVHSRGNVDESVSQGSSRAEKSSEKHENVHLAYEQSQVLDFHEEQVQEYAKIEKETNQETIPKTPSANRRGYPRNPPNTEPRLRTGERLLDGDSNRAISSPRSIQRRPSVFSQMDALRDHMQKSGGKLQLWKAAEKAPQAPKVLTPNPTRVDSSVYAAVSKSMHSIENPAPVEPLDSVDEEPTQMDEDRPVPVTLREKPSKPLLSNVHGSMNGQKSTASATIQVSSAVIEAAAPERSFKIIGRSHTSMGEKLKFNDGSQEDDPDDEMFGFVGRRNVLDTKLSLNKPEVNPKLTQYLLGGDDDPDFRVKETTTTPKKPVSSKYGSLPESTDAEKEKQQQRKPGMPVELGTIVPDSPPRHAPSTVKSRRQVIVSDDEERDLEVLSPIPSRRVNKHSTGDIIPSSLPESSSMESAAGDFLPPPSVFTSPTVAPKMDHGSNLPTSMPKEFAWYRSPAVDEFYYPANVRGKQVEYLGDDTTRKMMPRDEKLHLSLSYGDSLFAKRYPTARTKRARKPQYEPAFALTDVDWSDRTLWISFLEERYTEVLVDVADVRLSEEDVSRKMKRPFQGRARGLEELPPREVDDKMHEELELPRAPSRVKSRSSFVEHSEYDGSGRNTEEMSDDKISARKRRKTSETLSSRPTSQVKPPVKTTPHMSRRKNSSVGSSAIAVDSPTLRSLFHGCQFLCTGGKDESEKGEMERAKERIIAAGGEIIELDRFRGAKSERGVKSRYLIAPGPCRTSKYFLALAKGIPRVGLRWIMDCVRDGKLLDTHDYLLPNGVCGKRTFGYRNERCLLNGCSVYAVGIPSEEKELWVHILRELGANVVQKWTAQSSAQAGYLLAWNDHAVTEEMKERARCVKKQFLPKDWLMDCLIQQKRIPEGSFLRG